MNRPELSILIPTYNRSKYLDHLLNYIKDEIYALDFTYEIVISNNFSTDNTIEIIDKHKDDVELTIYSQNENIGAYNNVIFLINIAKGHYYIQLADDDLIDFELLNVTINKLKENKNCVAIYTPWQIWDYIENKSIMLFYQAPEVTITKNNHKDLGIFIIENKIFPEIGVFKTDTVKKLLPISFEHFFYAFKFPSEFITQGDIIFANIPFHKTLTKFNLNSETERHQEGWDARFIFNIYRNSFHHYLRLMNLEGQEKINMLAKINEFLYERLIVAYDLSLSHKEFIEAYEIGSIILGEFGKLNHKISHDVSCDFAKIDYIKRLINENKIKKVILIDPSTKIDQEKNFESLIQNLKKIINDSSVSIEINKYFNQNRCLYYIVNELNDEEEILSKISSDSIIVYENILDAKFI